MTDEESQNRIEKGFSGDGLDDKAYRRIFDILKQEPPFQLPPDFASKVIRRMQTSPRQSVTFEYFWLYVGLVSFAMASGISIYLTGFKIDLGVLKFLSSYPGLIAFAALFILGLQWIDKQFVRKTMAH